MPCTTILVGRNASYDGSTMMARNEDAGGSKSFDPKKFIVVTPEKQPETYHSVLSGVEIELPEHPMRYTAVPNAIPDEGIWGEAGINIENIAMTATETITSNPRVLGADPLVAEGIGEEDFLTLVLPYIHSAREGVLRLGALLEQYGTYEMNGVGFQDQNEIWWLETIGGHHWIARRVPDDCYIVNPNQQGIDFFDFTDATGEGRAHLCASGLPQLIEEHHLDCSMERKPVREQTEFDVRGALGSRADSDHSYNTPRAWVMERYLNPHTFQWDGPEADFSPESDDLPWCLTPERRITVEDVKYVLSHHYQGTPYDPYGKGSEASLRGKYRPVGINRNNFMSILQIRPYCPDEIRALQWIAMGSNIFNALVPFYANIEATPAYFANTDQRVTTNSFYWSNRLIAALADSQYRFCWHLIERYQNTMHSEAHRRIIETDRAYREEMPQIVTEWLEERNQSMSDFAEEQTALLLEQVLNEVSLHMQSAYDRSDA